MLCSAQNEPLGSTSHDEYTMKYFCETGLAGLPNNWPHKYLYQKSEFLLFVNFGFQTMTLAFISSMFHCCLKPED